MLHTAVGAAVAFGVGLIVIPLLGRLAHRLNITDRPDARLKPHARPIAYLGGAGFYLAWIAGLAIAHVLSGDGIDPRVWLVAAVGAGLLLVGLADDMLDVPPAIRLLAEVAAAVALFIGGARFGAIPLLDGWPVIAVAVAMHAVLVVGACNSVNLLDGLDGLCGGVLAIVMIGLAALAGVAILAEQAGGLALPADSLAGIRLVVVLTVPMAAALLAFLRYNYQPASIFMGDAGSLLLGLLAAACLILLAIPGWDGLTLLFGGLMIFALPIGDTMLAFVRRGLSGRPIMAGDRSHFYDQLVDRGLPVRTAVKLCYLLSIAFGAIGLSTAGVLVVFVGDWPGFVILTAIYAVVVATVAMLLRAGGFVRVDR